MILIVLIIVLCIKEENTNRIADELDELKDRLFPEQNEDDE